MTMSKTATASAQQHQQQMAGVGADAAGGAHTAAAAAATQRALVSADAGALDAHRALLDSIPQSGLKCDILFLVIRNRIAEEPEYVKRLRVVFQFNITKDNKPAATWTCDTRTSIEGDVYRSVPRNNMKADVTVTVDDDDWVKIMVGKLNPQRAFMMSKFKIRGNIMLLQKLHSVWFELRRKGRTPELDLIQEIMVSEPLIAGLKSEAMAIEIVQRVVKRPELVQHINGTVQLDVTQRGKLVTQYQIGLFPGQKPEFKRLYNATLPRAEQCANRPGAAQPDVRFIVDDDHLVLIMYGVLKFHDALATGRLRADGDAEFIERASTLLEQPPIMAKL